MPEIPKGIKPSEITFELQSTTAYQKASEKYTYEKSLLGITPTRQTLKDLPSLRGDNRQQAGWRGWVYDHTVGVIGDTVKVFRENRNAKASARLNTAYNFDLSGRVLPKVLVDRASDFKQLSVEHADPKDKESSWQVVCPLTAPEHVQEAARIINEQMKSAADRSGWKLNSDITYNELNNVLKTISEPDKAHSFGGGSGKGTVVGPISTMVLVSTLRPAGVDKVVLQVSDNARLGQFVSDFSRNYDLVLTDHPRVVGLQEGALQLSNGKTLKIVVIKEIGLNNEAALKDMRSIIDGADVILTERQVIKSIALNKQLDKAGDLHASLYNSLTAKSWAIFDESHELPTSPNLIQGRLGTKITNTAQLRAIEKVTKFIMGRKGEETSWQEFLPKLIKEDLERNSGGRSARFNDAFLTEYAKGDKSHLRWNGTVDLERLSDEERAALNGFADALTMQHRGKDMEGKGFAFVYDSQLEKNRIVPMSNGDPAPNMQWSDWNIAAAREIVGRWRLDGTEVTGGERLLTVADAQRVVNDVVRTSPSSVRISDSAVVSDFMVKSFMSATPHLADTFNTIQAIRQTKVPSPDLMESLRMSSRVQAGSVKSLFATLPENIDRHYILSHEFRGQYFETLESLRKSYSGKGVDILAVTGSTATLYRADGSIDTNFDINRAMDYLAKEAKDTNAAGKPVRPTIVLLDPTNVTGFDLRVALPEAVRTASMELKKASGNEIFDRIQSEIQKNPQAITSDRARKDLALKLNLVGQEKNLATYLEYKYKQTPVFVSMFDSRTTATMAEQTMVRDRGIGAGKEFGIHERFVWKVDTDNPEAKLEDITGANRKINGLSQKFNSNEKSAVSEALYSTLRNTLHEGMVNRFKIMYGLAKTDAEKGMILQMREKFQSEVGIDATLELPKETTILRALQADITRAEKLFYEIVKPKVADFSSSLRSYASDAVKVKSELRPVRRVKDLSVEDEGITQALPQLEFSRQVSEISRIFWPKHLAERFPAEGSAIRPLFTRHCQK